MTFDDDEDRPDRPVPARRVAEQRWKVGEPWRVRERRRRRLRIGGIVGVVAVVGVILAVTTSTPAIPPRDVAAVTAAGPGYRILFYGCHGEHLENLAVYPGRPPSSGVFSAGSLWYVEAEGAGLGGQLQIDLGQAPAGFRTVVAYRGLPASPPGGVFTLVARTNDQLVHFQFDPSLVAGGSVVTETGRYPLSSYQREESADCR